MYATLPTWLNFKLTVKTAARTSIGSTHVQAMVLNCVSKLKQAAKRICDASGVQCDYPRLRLKQTKLTRQEDYQLLTEFNSADLLSRCWIQGNYDDHAVFQVFVYPLETAQFDARQAIADLKQLAGTELLLDQERFERLKALCDQAGLLQ